jgi:hypothetical protein
MLEEPVPLRLIELTWQMASPNCPRDWGCGAGRALWEGFAAHVWAVWRMNRSFSFSERLMRESFSGESVLHPSAPTCQKYYVHVHYYCTCQQKIQNKNKKGCVEFAHEWHGWWWVICSYVWVALFLTHKGHGWFEKLPDVLQFNPL